MLRMGEGGAGGNRRWVLIRCSPCPQRSYSLERQTLGERTSLSKGKLITWVCLAQKASSRSCGYGPGNQGRPQVSSSPITRHHGEPESGKVLAIHFLPRVPMKTTEKSLRLQLKEGSRRPSCKYPAQTSFSGEKLCVPPKEGVASPDAGLSLGFYSPFQHCGGKHSDHTPSWHGLITLPSPSHEQHRENAANSSQDNREII